MLQKVSERVVHQLHQQNGQACLMILRYAQRLHYVGVLDLTKEATLLLDLVRFLGLLGSTRVEWRSLAAQGSWPSVALHTFPYTLPCRGYRLARYGECRNGTRHEVAAPYVFAEKHADRLTGFLLKDTILYTCQYSVHSGPNVSEEFLGLYIPIRCETKCKDYTLLHTNVPLTCSHWYCNTGPVSSTHSLETAT